MTSLQWREAAQLGKIIRIRRTNEPSWTRGCIRTIDLSAFSSERDVSFQYNSIIEFEAAVVESDRQHLISQVSRFDVSLAGGASPKPTAVQRAEA